MRARLRKLSNEDDSRSHRIFPSTPPNRLGRDGIVSIVIPAFNSTATLRRALPSILAQRDLDLVSDIVVVDSSSDGLMPDLIREYEPLGVTFIISGVGIMPAVQRNIGARASRGELLLFLDSDVILEEDYVSKIVAFYRRGHLAGFGSVSLPPFQARKVVAVAQYYLQLSEYLPSGTPRIKPFVLGCSNFVSRELFEKAGGYPEIRAAEDVLYGHSLAALAPIWFLPEATVAHIFREDWGGYLRNQRLLGKFVARYRGDKPGGSLFKGPLLPLILFPAIIGIKAARIIPRIVGAGLGHALRCALVLPAFTVGIVFWGLGFVEEARTLK